VSDYGVILFHTTSSAIRAEKVAQKAGYDCKLIPTPREFSSDCGIALRFAWGDADGIKGCLEEVGVELANVYRL
jgi:hypothetical protein